MASYISELRAIFDSLSIKEKQLFIQIMQDELKGSKDKKREKFLNECVKKYDSIIENEYHDEELIKKMEFDEESIKEIRFSLENKSRSLLYAALCLAFIAVVWALAFPPNILTDVSDTMASQENYSILCELSESTEAETRLIPFIAEFDAQMRQINHDYLSWINIGGTVVDYPVVRGRDNEKYLNTSFSGDENPIGTLFMDYRCVGEHVPHIIIYGHNLRNGGMFGSLRKFLDELHMAEHPIITLEVNGRIVEYEIFSARRTDINDPAYHLDFSIPGSFRAFIERNGAPPDAVQIITLSTCVGEGNDDERMIVQGVLR